MSNKQAAIKIIRRLRKEGFDAYLAGGCVRDMLLKRAAKDYDVATSAHPDDIIGIFKRTRKVGAKFGVVMVLMGAGPVEVATFRSESGYADGRHPDSVKFSNAKQDCARRDFTINGMFYDPIEKQVIDFVNGRRDLDKKILRTIGDPEKRFGEDYLRMLRAVRFAAQLDFQIDKKTFKAIQNNAAQIVKISGERIAMETEAILTSTNRGRGASLLTESNLAESIFPGMTKQETEFGITVLGHLPSRVDFPLALAAFFAGSDLAFASQSCKHLRLSRAHSKHFHFLLAERGKLLDAEMPLADLKIILACPYFQDLYELQRAIQKAAKESISPLKTITKRAQALKGKELTPKPLLDGHQLIALGARPGQTVGQLSREMYIEQLSEHLETPEQARIWVRKWLKHHEPLDA